MIITNCGRDMSVLSVLMMQSTVSYLGPQWVALGQCIESCGTWCSVLPWATVGCIGTVHWILWDMMQCPSVGTVGCIGTVLWILWDMMQCPSVGHSGLQWSSAFNPVGHDTVSQCGPQCVSLWQCIEAVG